VTPAIERGAAVVGTVKCRRAVMDERKIDRGVDLAEPVNLRDQLILTISIAVGWDEGFRNMPN
jgi:hypothetical protein